MKSRHVLAMLPLALGIATQVARVALKAPTQPKVTTTAPASAAGMRNFSIPINNLRDWAGTVVVSIDGVKIEGHSNVHKIDADCEMHLGAHTQAFQGSPAGLVLEPMNACVEPFPGKSSQNDADWVSWGDDLVNKGVTVMVSGVPRIWPEHLVGGGASNPDHAVELHPLTGLVSSGKNVDFAPNVFAGDFRGGLKTPTALNIVKNTAVLVTNNGGSAEISFSAGTIGNFTVLDIDIDQSSIASDGAGSFRMNGEVLVDNSTKVPVRIVTAKGSLINTDMPTIKNGPKANASMEALVLFSLSPESLLAAANKSHGDPVAVEQPIQLILYGPPNSQ